MLDLERIKRAVVRVPKSHPAYSGNYDRFDVVRNYADSFANFFMIGRNGMHKYNNQDHSMLTAMIAVENIVNGLTAKDNIWAINTEMDYQKVAERREASRELAPTAASRKIAVAGTTIE
ncbi:MAG: hypothetical protein ABSD61_00155 [Terracidiphilus sp.]|jgi:NADH:ubiquinone oxidoreductase subunit F (NADH-binding)